ncbi:Hypothetical Protein FCC1311_066962 [Hondaea fermentalgiana]|uniref:Chloride channel protein n=1 Tax=Hondaea fermentalgiana TaxID=2315210 RepID=A0A2R5GHV7_9STRA|nr:Hypothetical Protein FCC1311_066962 [Hondaea fermentalgiana]|eukprot:GBG30477.1 Hypothetical Protein FCC1311_066962 [Hondaea fermentalgiana]
MCSSYAQEWEFALDISAGIVFGCIVGVLCAALVWPMRELPILWTTTAYPGDPESVQLLHGKPYWIAVIGGTGALVGVLKLVVALEDDYDGLFKQINQQYVNPYNMMKLVLISVVSVSGGAALGPSAVLGSVGGAVAQVFSELRGFDDDRVRRSCLHGIGAALGCLFPSPVTPMVLVGELGPGDELQAYYLRYFAEMGTSVLAAYAVNLVIAGRSYLPFVPIGGELGPYEFESIHLVWGVIFGLLSGVVGLLIAIGIGVSTQVFRSFKRWLPVKVYTVLAPAVGGLLIGAVSIVVPLGFGSGNSQLLAVISHVMAHKVSASLLVASVAAKIICVSISVGSGFVGGVVFPLYFVGACLGLAMHMLLGEVTGEPLLLFLSCFISAVPASLFPIPITHLVTVMGMLEIGESNCAPMFAACIVSNIVCNGSGALVSLLKCSKRDDLFDAPAMPAVTEAEGDDADFMDFPEYRY